MKIYWLKGKVSPGQFSGECVVEAKDFRNKGFSLFAPDELVEHDAPLGKGLNVDGWLQVDLLGKQDNLALIRLPRMPLENGPTVTVKLEQLDYRPAREYA